MWHAAGVGTGRQQSGRRRGERVGSPVGAPMAGATLTSEGVRMTEVWRLLRGWADQRPGGMNDSQIARALKVRPAVVGKWKAGARPGPENLRKIAELTGVDITILRAAVLEDLGYTLTGEEPSDGPPPPPTTTTVDEETG